MKNLLLTSLLSYFLVACGGGGGGAATTTPAPTPEPPAGVVNTLFSTSYENMKNKNFPQFKIPTGTGLSFSSAVAMGDFFGDGSTIVMLSNTFNSVGCMSNGPGGTEASPSCLGPAPTYIKDEYRAVLKFYKLTASNTLEDTGKTVQGCLTPRKAMVADFNRDGKPDIFIACHGWDTVVPFFPGEPSRLLINDGHGSFNVSDVGATDRNADGRGYYHGASVADINGDGYPDIALVDNFRNNFKNVTVLLNQPTSPGTFVVDDNRITGLTEGPYFSVELVDLNGDGKVDIVAGGQEPHTGGNSWDKARTVVLYNDGTGKFGFGANDKVVIPLVDSQSIAIDFTVFTKAADEKVLMISRTDYATQSVQIFNLKTNTSTVVQQTDNTWVEWWVPAIKNGIKGINPHSDSRNKDSWVALP